MNQDVKMENKKEDKKFLVKFLVVLAVAFIVGIVCGVGMAILEDMEQIPDAISNAVYHGVVLIAPYVSIVFCVIMGCVIYICREKAIAMMKAWDGENEEEYQKIDDMLGNALYALNIGTVITYFFFGVGFEDIAERGLWADVCYFCGFIGALVVIIVGQNIIVNLTKEINPEKKGSVYDMKFIDKWEDSCDEAEKILIYKSSYRTYRSTSCLFLALWIFCVFGNDIFHFGLMPVTIVSIIWLWQVCSYTYYTKYYTKHPEKIGVFK